MKKIDIVWISVTPWYNIRKSSEILKEVLDHRKENEINTKSNISTTYLTEKTWLENVALFDDRQKKQGFLEICKETILKALAQAWLTIQDADWIYTSHTWSYDITPHLAQRLCNELWFDTSWNHIIARDVWSACAWWWEALDSAYKELIYQNNENKEKVFVVLSWDILWSEITEKNPEAYKERMIWDGLAALIITNKKIKSLLQLSVEKMMTWVGHQQSKEWLDWARKKQGKAFLMSYWWWLWKILLHTWNQILKGLGLDNITTNLFILPHQPNGEMIRMREEVCTIIQKARDDGFTIEVCKDIFYKRWNLSGASIFFALYESISSWKIENFDDIVLAAFWAWGWISWAKLKKIKAQKKTDPILLANNYFNLPETLPWYKDFWVSQRSNHDTITFPTETSLENILAQLDYKIGMKLFFELKEKKMIPVTTSISYENNDNAVKYSWNAIVTSTKDNEGKRTKHLYDVELNNIKIQLTFVELDPPKTNINNRNLQEDRNEDEFIKGNNIVKHEEINLYWSLLWPASMRRLLDWNNELKNDTFSFLSSASLGDELEIIEIWENWKTTNINIPGFLQEKRWKLLINKTTWKVIASLTF